MSNIWHLARSPFAVAAVGNAADPYNGSYRSRYLPKPETGSFYSAALRKGVHLYYGVGRTFVLWWFATL